MSQGSQISGNARFLQTVHLGDSLRVASLRGGAVTIAGQIVKFLLQVGSTMVLARLLAPEDYGLVGMVAVLIAFLQMFKDAGLSTATVQREQVSHEQISTLFWINCGLACALAVVLAAISPLIAWFYQEPRLIPITLALAAGFLLSGLGVQHFALMRRQMRFLAITLIDLCAMSCGIVVAIVMARAHYGYWALVGMTLTTLLTSVVATWCYFPWLPSLPRRRSGVRPMLRFGGFIVGSEFLNMFVRNGPQVLVGWLSGAAQLGLYNKAYQLLMLPVQQVYGPIGQVLVPALSRVQSQPDQLRQLYLGAYSLAVSITLPITAVSIVFANEIILVVLGHRWEGAIPVFRYLAVAGVFIGVMSPTGWFLIASGRTARYFKLDFIEMPFVLIACLIGAQYGAIGIALGFAIARGVECVPMLFLIFRGTEVSLSAIGRALTGPVTGIIAAAAVGWSIRLIMAPQSSPFLLLAVGVPICFAVYAITVLVGFRKWRPLRDVFVAIFRKKSGISEVSPVE